ncbi:hypothetical protein MC7420_2590 [Coleofasciculus chthonoplastes PCC 7420]|uniref:Uncharacterized protein n=1 Tax=Coleofasciculus chthonoplastes PCC 7420 TaxID=118168 RepID=B4VYM7_9CYAN|nr:hypothetical protein [Coleofasciculus chthonoplastes]EDX72972.1 hypothetical protein MC7420_2590 [Coleofasciculus chthonoplastes PCC 7420]
MKLDQLFLNEAFSNYVVFFAGILVASVGWAIGNYLSRKKPQIIGVNKVSESSLLEIDRQIKKNIKVEYMGKSINSLYQTSFHIFNRGDVTIDNINLQIYIEDASLTNNIINYWVADQYDNQLLNASSLLQDGIEIKIDFLNSLKLYKEKIIINVYSSQPLKIKDARGRGKGWRVEYFDQIKYGEELDANLYLLSSGSWVNLIEGISGFLFAVIEGQGKTSRK